MKIKTALCKDHPAYKWCTKIVPKGIHLMRGSKPDLKNGSSFIPHAFVDADQVYQYLPWDYKAWFQGKDTTQICILAANDTGRSEEVDARCNELIDYLFKLYSLEESESSEQIYSKSDKEDEDHR